MNNWLTYHIKIFHLLVFIFFLLAPFSNDPSVLELHFLLTVVLVLKWTFVAWKCTLTFIEHKFRGVEEDETIAYAALHPMFNLGRVGSRWYRYTLFAAVVLIGGLGLIKFRELLKSGVPFY